MRRVYFLRVYENVAQMTGRVSCLLSVLCALYVIVQCAVNYRTFKQSCEGASVAMFLNLVSFVAALLALIVFAPGLATTDSADY